MTPADARARPVFEPKASSATLKQVTRRPPRDQGLQRNVFIGEIRRRWP